MTVEKISEYMGYLGLILVNIAPVPAIIMLIGNPLADHPPFNLILLLTVGLSLLWLRSIVRKEKLTIIHFGAGTLGQGILLFLIW